MKRFTLSTFFLLLSFSVLAQNFPVSKPLYQKIQNLFYEGGVLSTSKVETYKMSLEKRADEIYQLEYNYRISKKDQKISKAEKKALKNSYVRATQLVLDRWMNRIEKTQDPVKQIELLSEIIDLDNALKSEITPYSSEGFILRSIREGIYNYRIEKNTVSAYGEASNLVNPETGAFYSQEELKTLKKSGVDLSLLNPPKRNGVVNVIKDISKVNVTDRYQGGNNPLHQSYMKGFPKDNIGYFKELRKTQTRPKLIFETKDAKGKVNGEFKLKMGKEIHSEPTTAALGVALGLNHDLSKYVSNIKIYTDDLTWDEFALDFATYFEATDLKKIVASHGFEEGKGNYIVFKEGLLEARFDKKQLYRVGPFYPGEKKGKRETRALLAFNMWVQNTDLKPGENNKTIIRDYKNEAELFYLQHDVGFSFGNFERERPTDFPWDMIRRENRKRIVFNFRSFVPNQGWDHVTFADMKWMVRKIAQLTRAQITEAVSLGHWPNKAPFNFHQLIIEKLIKRRNDLVKAFDLEGEVLGNGNTITLMKYNRGIEKEAIIPVAMLDGETIDYRPAVKYNYLVPGMKALWNAVVDGVAGVSRSLRRINVDPKWIGLNSPFGVMQVLVGTNRQIVKNPEPTNQSDQYIVREDFRIGLRLGVGTVVTGDAAYIKQFSLIYPAKDIESVSKHGKWIFDFTMPYRVAKNFLPKKHILISEDFIERGPHLRLETPSFGGGIDVRLNRVTLKRTILGNTNDTQIKLFEDHSKYNEQRSKAFSKVIINLKHFSTESQSGRINRDIYVVKRDGRDETDQAIDRAFMHHDYEMVKDLSPGILERVKSKYTSHFRKYNFLGFWSNEKYYRQDDLYLFEVDENGKAVMVDHQLEGTSQKKSYWRTLFNQEERIARVTMSAKIGDNKELIDPFITFSFQHFDINTKVSEIDGGYIPFLNGVAGNEKFIPFTAANHAFTKDFGQTNLYLRIQYYKEGLKNLLSISKDQFFKALSLVTKVDQDVLSGKKNTTTNELRYINKSYKLGRLRRKAERVFDLISESKNELTEKLKVKKLLRALTVAVPRKKQSQNPIILATLNKIVGEENLYMTAEIDVPEGQENKFPGENPFYNTLGSKRGYGDRELHILDIRDALSVYFQFQ